MSHNDYINTKQLGKRIKESREMLTDEDGKKVTQEALANILDFSATYIRHVEGGRRTPRLSYFIDFCNALNVSPNFLLKDHLTCDNGDLLDEVLLKVKTLRPDKLPVLLEIIQLLDNIK